MRSLLLILFLAYTRSKPTLPFTFETAHDMFMNELIVSEEICGEIENEFKTTQDIDLEYDVGMCYMLLGNSETEKDKAVKSYELSKFYFEDIGTSKSLTNIQTIDNIFEWRTLNLDY
jgi:hypothetical protein